jgi:hypothetical protein
MPASSWLSGEHPMVLESGCGQVGAMKNIESSSHALSTGTRPPSPPVRPSEVKASPWRDEVARTAYFIYLNQGSPQGKDVQHWLAAEAQMTAPTKAVAATSLR